MFSLLPDALGMMGFDREEAGKAIEKVRKEE